MRSTDQKLSRFYTILLNLNCSTNISLTCSPSVTVVALVFWIACTFKWAYEINHSIWFDIIGYLRRKYIWGYSHSVTATQIETNAAPFLGMNELLCFVATHKYSLKKLFVDKSQAIYQIYIWKSRAHHLAQICIILNYMSIHIYTYICLYVFLYSHVELSIQTLVASTHYRIGGFRPALWMLI